jgi:hypothetical protein
MRPGERDYIGRQKSRDKRDKIIGHSALSSLVGKNAALNRLHVFQTNFVVAAILFQTRSPGAMVLKHLKQSALLRLAGTAEAGQ